MAKKCKSCGAPLEFSGEQTEVKCNYCNTINSNTSINVGKIVSEFFKHTPQVVRRKTNPKSLAFIIILTIGMPVAISLYNLKASFWTVHWYSDCQFIDYNNDQALDIIGFGRKHANTQILTVIDGETGESLVDNDIQELGVFKNLYCLDNKHIITTSIDEICYYSKNDLSLQHTFEYTGTIQGFQVIDEVLCFNLYDSGENQYFGMDIKNGEEIKCKKKKLKLPKISNHDNYYTEPTTKIKYEVKYSNKTKTTITATKRKKKLWEKKLEGIKIESRNAFQHTSNSIVVFGKKKNEKSKIFIKGIDKETGEETFETFKEEDFVILNDVYYNNKYVICYWNTGLEAYNPDTGELVWKI